MSKGYSFSKGIVCHAAVLLCYFIYYYFLRLPTAQLRLAYYDDGETLYHVLNILQGGVPYKDDQTHHFLGYILPFFFGSKVLGFSAELIRAIACINQVATAYGVFLCLRMFCRFPLSLLGGLLLLSSREPWVLGFYIQYELNALYVFVLYCSLRYVMQPGSGWLAAASFLAGLSFTYDQRAVFFLLVPLSAFFCSRKSSDKLANPLFLNALLFLAAPLAMIFYLSIHGALSEFIEQAFIFPKQYRVGSQSFAQQMTVALQAYRHLIEATPLLFTAGTIGLVALLLELREAAGAEKHIPLVMLTAALPPFIYPFFGGRDLEYYTVPWLPWLSIVAIIAGRQFFQSAAVRSVWIIFLLAQPLLSAAGAAKLISEGTYAAYDGDGVRETVTYLREHLTSADSVFVWGYRPDIYVYLNRRSPYPFANRMMIHPDQAITDPAERLKHIHPGYQELFYSLLENKPPTYIVRFIRDDSERLGSASHEKILQVLGSSYTKVFAVTKKDVTNGTCTFEIYRSVPAHPHGTFP